MKAYINYPNPHFTLHWNDACPHFQMHHKEGQRVVRITAASIEAALSRFIAREFTFASKPEENDMWLDISLASPSARTMGRDGGRADAEQAPDEVRDGEPAGPRRTA